MALPPAPFAHEQFDLQWRQWLSLVHREVEPAPGAGNNPSTPVIITDPEYTVQAWPLIILCDTDVAGNMLIKMPATSLSNDVYHIKKLGTGGDVTVDGNSSETIDGGVIATIKLENESMMVVSDANKWYVI
jgi:predicted outer membrane repeat protein